jgi:hypothetical protein
MARFPETAEGSWTEHYPQLGTGSVSYEDSISPEFYEVERKAVFKRAWLNVGRVEQLPRKGSYFTKELKVVNTSIIVVRTDPVRSRPTTTSAGTAATSWCGTTCRSRRPAASVASSPASTTPGAMTSTATSPSSSRRGVLRPRQEPLRLGAVHCDVWEGFIFVNFAKEPEQSLRDFLGR